MIKLLKDEEISFTGPVEENISFINPFFSNSIRSGLITITNYRIYIETLTISAFNMKSTRSNRSYYFNSDFRSKEKNIFRRYMYSYIIKEIFFNANTHNLRIVSDMGMFNILFTVYDDISEDLRGLRDEYGIKVNIA